MPVRDQEILVKLRLSGFWCAVISDIQFIKRLGDAHRRPDVNINAGFEWRTRSFLDKSLRDQDIEYSRIFLRAIAGLKPSF